MLSELLLLGALHIGTALAGSVCNRWPYDDLLYLSKYPPAQAYCSHQYPQPPCTSTKVRVYKATTTTVIIPITDSTKTITTATTTATVTTGVSTATVTTGTITDSTIIGTDTITVFTATVTKTVFTETDTATVYTATKTDTVVTGTSTATTTTSVATITSTTSTFTSTITVTNTITTTPATVTVTTYSHTPLRKREAPTEAPTPVARSYPPPIARAHRDQSPPKGPDHVLKALEASPRGFISTACSCIQTHAPCKTITLSSTPTSTKTKTVHTTGTTSVEATVTDSVEGTTTVSVDTTTVLSVDATVTTSIDSTTVLSMVTTTTLSKITTTTLSVKATITVSVVGTTTQNVIHTTSTTQTSTKTVTAPTPTRTVSGTRAYTLVYGPVDGCAYTPHDSIDSTVSTDASTYTTHEERIQFCASYCDSIPGCISFGMEYFPICPAAGGAFGYVSCIAVAEKYVPGEADLTECDIGVNDHCLINQDAVIYNAS